METILEGEIAFIVALQSLGIWFVLPMKFFTFLGSQEFFFLILPALYWSIDAGLGVRVGTVLLISGGLNNVLKLAFFGPRPYWYSPQVKALLFEPSFGVPSGHSQNSLSVWGMLASRIRRPWAWAVAIVIILMIGLSRLFLGVHFPHDVLLGWLVGGVVLGMFLHYWDPVEAWVQKQSLSMQIGLAFALSLLMLAAGLLFLLPRQSWVFPSEWIANIQAGATQLPEPVTLNDITGIAGTLFGLLSGLAWINSRGGFAADGLVWKRVARYLLGLVGVLVLWFGLGIVFPRGEEIISYLLRYIHFALLGVWISAGAPILFLRLKLAEKAH